VRFRKYLEIIVTENLIENANKVGEYFVNQLMQLAGEFEGLVSAVRGRGLMIAFDLPGTEIRNRYLQSLFNNGVIALSSGKRAIRFRPSLNLTTDLVDEAMSALRKSLAELHAKEQAVAV